MFTWEFLTYFLRFQKPLFGISFLVFHFLWIIFHQIGNKLNYTKRVIIDWRSRCNNQNPISNRVNEKVSFVINGSKINGLCANLWLSEVESRTQGSRPRTQKNFEAKGRPSRDQGQGPRTQAQVFSKKRRFSKKIFTRWKRSSKIFFQTISTWGKQKRSLQFFCEVSGALQQNFNVLKNSAVLEPRTAQFLGTWGFEAKAKDFKMCPRGLHLQWLLTKSIECAAASWQATVLVQAFLMCMFWFNILIYLNDW